ncbi:MAG: hypothetical protein LUE17_08695 [Planctomycetaceae bacterium]|nr:hypothetical protein [Planctomycetaceae bacterium]
MDKKQIEVQANEDLAVTALCEAVGNFPLKFLIDHLEHLDVNSLLNWQEQQRVLQLLKGGLTERRGEDAKEYCQARIEIVKAQLVYHHSIRLSIEHVLDEIYAVLSKTPSNVLAKDAGLANDTMRALGSLFAHVLHVRPVSLSNQLLNDAV